MIDEGRRAAAGLRSVCLAQDGDIMKSRIMYIESKAGSRSPGPARRSTTKAGRSRASAAVASNLNGHERPFATVCSDKTWCRPSGQIGDLRDGARAALRGHRRTFATGRPGQSTCTINGGNPIQVVKAA